MAIIRLKVAKSQQYAAELYRELSTSAHQNANAILASLIGYRTNIQSPFSRIIWIPIESKIDGMEKHPVMLRRLSSMNLVPPACWRVFIEDIIHRPVRIRQRLLLESSDCSDYQHETRVLPRSDSSAYDECHLVVSALSQRSS